MSKKCYSPYMLLRCQQGLLVGESIPLGSEEIPGDEGDEFIPPVWNFRIGGHTIETLFPSLLGIKKIILSQGLSQGLVATEQPEALQTPVQVMGTTVVHGKTLYVFADPVDIP